MTVKSLYQKIRYQLLQRHIYAITGPFRVLPDSIVIGVGRGGTTSLFHYLGQHKCVRKSAYDEIGFFDDNYHLGLNWYRSMFPTRFTKNSIEKKFGKFIAYEVTPWYIRRPWDAKRIHGLIPNVKLIAVLRNPVDRAYSHYHLSRRIQGLTTPFEDVVLEDMKRINEYREKNGEINDNYFKTIVQNSFLARGFYAEQLKKWYEIFNDDQILVVPSEDLSEQTQKTLNKIFIFLGLEPETIPNLEKVNVAKYPPMEQNTRLKLLEFYSKYNQDLYDMLNLEFPWQN